MILASRCLLRRPNCFLPRRWLAPSLTWLLSNCKGNPALPVISTALGIVVYEWLCGVRPFEGSYWQLLNQHVSALPPPLREKDPSLPEAVESVVLKALAKNPEQRYVSVQLFAQALERASRGRSKHSCAMTQR